VILNVGRELGVITDEVFAMMVLMALVTTALTTPILQLIYPDRLFAAAPTLEKPVPVGVFSVLVSIAKPENAPDLIALARMLAGGGGRLIALHLLPARDHDAYRSAADGADAVHDEVLETAIRQASLARGGPEPGSLEPISLVSADPAQDIVEVARSKRADLVIVGQHQPVFGQTMLGGTVHRVLEAAPANVGVFVDRGTFPPRRVLVPYLGSPHDRLALELARRLTRNVEAAVTVLHVVPTSSRAGQRLGAAEETTRVFQDPTQPVPVTFRVLPDDSPADAVIREAAGFDLVIIGVAKEWGLESHLFGWRPEKIAQSCPCSLLIVRKQTPQV
jgi:nucleotide-binding universal stress UspA family protein